MAPSTGRPGGTPERPARFFADATEFRTWLDAHHATETELWMGLLKRHVPDRGLTWAEAVPEAIAYGWIDSKSERIDDDARRQRRLDQLVDDCAHGRLIKSQRYGDPPRWLDRAATAARAASPGAVDPADGVD